jgi:TrmH family RNA methyltransferase
VSTRDLDAITDTMTPQGIVAVLQQRVYTADAVLRCADGQCILVAFDGISDPGNVGSMVRTCDWFGVNGILIGRNSVELYNPKVLRGTMGGVFHLPIADGVDLPVAISHAKDLGYKVYVADPHGETHFDHVTYEAKSLIIFGNEAWGVSDQVKRLADMRLVIRRYGAGESLNVGVACGIVLSAVHRLYD